MMLLFVPISAETSNCGLTDEDYSMVYSFFVDNYAQDVKNYNKEKVNFSEGCSFRIVDETKLKESMTKIEKEVLSGDVYSLYSVQYDDVDMMLFFTKDNKLINAGGQGKAFYDAKAIVNKLTRDKKVDVFVVGYGFNNYMYVIEENGVQYVLPFDGTDALQKDYYKVNKLSQLPTAEEFVQERIRIIEYYKQLSSQNNGEMVYGDSTVKLSVHKSVNYYPAAIASIAVILMGYALSKRKSLSKA